MQHFHKFPVTLDVGPALAQLDAHPELWNVNPERTEHSASPHAAADDIWLRWRRKEELVSRASYGETHVSVWWPAIRALPAMRHLIWQAVDATGSDVQLGGVLLTRLPPGACILPHHDQGSWHAEHYDQKLYVTLRNPPQGVNVTADEPAVFAPGSMWTFDNQKVHSVHNMGDEDKITLIICTRKAT